MNDSGIDLATLSATVTLEDEEEHVGLKLTPVGRRFELEVGSFYLELCSFPSGEYSCFHFDDRDTFEVVNKTEYSNLAINDCIRFSFVEKAEGMKFLMRLSTANILKPLCAEDDNVYEAINYAELGEINRPKLRSNVQHVLEKVLKPFLPRRSPKESRKTQEDLEDSIYDSIDEQQLQFGSDGALTRSPSNSSGQPTPPAHIYEGNYSLTRNIVNTVNYSRPKRRPPAPPKDLSARIDDSALEAINNYQLKQTYVTLR